VDLAGERRLVAVVLPREAGVGRVGVGEAAVAGCWPAGVATSSQTERALPALAPAIDRSPSPLQERRAPAAPHPRFLRCVAESGHVTKCETYSPWSGPT